MDWYTLAKLAASSFSRYRPPLSRNRSEARPPPPPPPPDTISLHPETGAYWVPLFTFRGSSYGSHGSGSGADDEVAAPEPEVEWTPVFPSLSEAELDRLFRGLPAHAHARWNSTYHYSSVNGVVLVGVPAARWEAVKDVLPEWEHDDSYVPEHRKGVLSLDFSYESLDQVMRRTAEKCLVNLPGDPPAERNSFRPREKPSFQLPPRPGEGSDDYYRRLVQYTLSERERERRMMAEYEAKKADPKPTPPRRDSKVWGD